MYPQGCLNFMYICKKYEILAIEALKWIIQKMKICQMGRRFESLQFQHHQVN